MSVTYLFGYRLGRNVKDGVLGAIALAEYTYKVAGSYLVNIPYT